LDTVFAPATAPGRAAVAVMRLSGPATRPALDALLRGRLPPPRRAALRRLRDAAGAVLDEALVLWFPGPASYTGEDSAELHLHGGPAVTEGVADALLALGLRPAEAGEFTRRAVLNGRMDLTAAEGVLDLIEAETAAQRDQALRLAGGALAALSDAWAARLAALLARQEALIEFEDEVPDGVERAIAGGADALAAEMEARLASDEAAGRVRSGLAVALLGAPNAGKSTLLNALVGRDAAIVSPVAGTTRDVVEARAVLAGLPATLSDTAGLREAGDAIEAEGVRRARRLAGTADILLLLLPAGEPPDPAVLALAGHPRALLVASRADLGGTPHPGALLVSALTGAGMPALRAALEAAARDLAPASGGALMARPRHRAAVRDAAARLREAGTGGEAAALPELRADALREALRALGRLTGRVGAEAILDRVFREFCIGK